MPIETSWYNTERTLIYHRFVEHWTLDELMDAFSHAQHLIQASGRLESDLKAFIVDLRDTNYIPTGILAARNRLISRFYKHHDVTIVIGANCVIKVIAMAYLHLADEIGALYIVDTPEEMMPILAKY